MLMITGHRLTFRSSYIKKPHQEKPFKALIEFVKNFKDEWATKNDVLERVDALLKGKYKLITDEPGAIVITSKWMSKRLAVVVVPRRRAVDTMEMSLAGIDHASTNPGWLSIH